MQLAPLKFLTGSLHPSLFRGLESKSTYDAIATVVGIFIDYEKAFELADPNSILHLLVVDKGIKGHLLGLFKYFWSNRTGYIRV